MTTLFDPMTSSSSPALDMLEGALETDKTSELRENKASGSAHASPEPESVTVTVSTVDDPSVGASNCLGSQQNPTQSYADPNAIQFQYRTDNGHVHNASSFDHGGPHIRVVQVHGADDPDPSVDRVDVAVSGNNFVQASHVAQQTVIQSPFSESPPTHGGDSDSSRFAYYPQTSNEQGNSSNVQTENMDSSTAYIVRTVPVSGLSQPSSPIPATNVIPVTQGAQGTVILVHVVTLK